MAGELLEGRGLSELPSRSVVFGELANSLFKGVVVGGIVGCFLPVETLGVAVGAVTGAAIGICVAHRNLNKRYVELQNRESVPPEEPEERPWFNLSPAAWSPESLPPEEPEERPADVLIGRNCDLPALLHTLDQNGHTAPTSFDIDVENFGRFQIHHVPDDGNCLFAAIGHFVCPDLDQNPQKAQRIVRDSIEARTDGRLGPWGGEDEARLAAMAYERRVFIIHRDYANQNMNVPAVETTQGYDINGNPIDMGQIARGQVAPINPGQGPNDDIVLYFDLDPERDPSRRHIEALIRQ
ncbi:MAG: hypothetical protein LBC30_00380 [Puniceicoccales bacterium]|jgi:hypothetical protein|nr:hypothetical protein [Puniceicoccales bacterium]